jgi:hypothetical protein
MTASMAVLAAGVIVVAPVEISAGPLAPQLSVQTVDLVAASSPLVNALGYAVAVPAFVVSVGAELVADVAVLAGDVIGLAAVTAATVAFNPSLILNPGQIPAQFYVSVLIDKLQADWDKALGDLISVLPPNTRSTFADFVQAVQQGPLPSEPFAATPSSASATAAAAPAKRSAARRAARAASATAEPAAARAAAAPAKPAAARAARAAAVKVRTAH